MPKQMTRLVVGQRIRIRLLGSSGDWCEGVVAVASNSNPSSVGLLLGGVLRSKGGTWLGGGMPLLVDYDAQTVKSLLGEEYEIEVAG